MDAPAASTSLEGARQRYMLFQTTWLVTVLCCTLTAVASWYLGLTQIDIEPVIWALGALALIQWVLGTRARRSVSSLRLSRLAFAAQLTGFGAIGATWHSFGGLQQPVFPLLCILPLAAGALVLTFWQRQASLVVLLLVLVSGLCLTPDTNSFIEQRYALGLAPAGWVPGWLPRSRVAFPDVTTSPAYDLMLTASMVLLAAALSTVARAAVALVERALLRTDSLRLRLADAEELSRQLVSNAPAAEALIVAATGRIANASRRFVEAFHVQAPADGQYLLDAVRFSQPKAVNRLLASGGVEIQSASVLGREMLLRITVDRVGGDAEPTTRLRAEPCDDICWRGVLDALDEPTLALNSRGDVVLLNRSASTLFGASGDPVHASTLFDSGSTARWWDIAPFESAQRLLDRGEHKYLASIRRGRIAASLDEWSFVHIHERPPQHAVDIP